MKQFISALLLFVFLVQSGLASTFDGLEHARTGHAKYVAQHSHDHATTQTTADQDANNADSADSPATRGHDECGPCHLFHTLVFVALRHQALPSASADIALASVTDHPLGIPSQPPYRPNWRALA